MIHRQWATLGKPTPWVFVLGAPPAAIAAAGMPLPERVNEDGYVGVPIDQVKPKSSSRLQRERNLEADPRAALLVEHWNRDDW